MARMPFEKNKKKIVENEGHAGRAKSGAKSRKTGTKSRGENVPPFIGESSGGDTPQPIAPIRAQKENGADDTLMEINGSEGSPDEMNPNGRGSVEPDPAMHGRIAEQAFMLFQESGGRHGHDWADWFEAERRIRET